MSVCGGGGGGGGGVSIKCLNGVLQSGSLKSSSV